MSATQYMNDREITTVRTAQQMAIQFDAVERIAARRARRTVSVCIATTKPASATTTTTNGWASPYADPARRITGRPDQNSK